MDAVDRMLSLAHDLAGDWPEGTWAKVEALSVGELKTLVVTLAAFAKDTRVELKKAA